MVIVVHNSARGKQLTAGRSSRLLPLPFAQRESEFLIANLELEFRPSARKQTAQPKSNRKYSCDFLSCDPEGLEFSFHSLLIPSHRFSNRERAIRIYRKL